MKKTQTPDQIKNPNTKQKPKHQTKWKTSNTKPNQNHESGKSVSNWMTDWPASQWINQSILHLSKY